MNRYEPRLRGRASSEDLEVARLMIRDEIGSETRIGEHGSPRRRRIEPESSPAPKVPPLRPAALEPTWSKGRLILLSKSAEDNGSVMLPLAFKLLRAEIVCLSVDADFDGNIDQKSIAHLRSVAGRIPVCAPAQDELFYLAHLKEFLEAYAKTANNEWPDFFVSRLAAVTDHFDRTIQQFPKWRDFVSNAEKDPLTFEEATEIPALANMMVAALRENEARNLIDPAVPSVLEVFQAPLQSERMRPRQQIAGPGESSKLLLANDLFASIDNVTKRIAEAALEIKILGRTTAKMGFASETLSSAEENGGQAYIWMTRTLLKLITSTPTRVLHSKFCWLKPIVCLIGH
jgi:hypothetical protein